MEYLSLRTAPRLGGLTLYGVLSWRLMLLTRLGRTGPVWPAEVFFTEVERRFMARHAKTVRMDPLPTLEVAVRPVALRGGYLNRSRDGPPGPPTRWSGLERLTMATLVMDRLESEDD